ETHAAERYLLGELAGPEAEMFEEHYFDCAACAEDIRDGARLMDVGREVVLTEPNPQTKTPVANPVRRRSQGGWMSLAAAAILLVGLGLGTLIPEPGADAIYATPQYQTDVSRSAIDVYRAHEPITVGHDFDEGEEFFVEIYAKEKRVRRAKLNSELKNKGGLITTGELPAGAYEMKVISVHADGNRVVTPYPFKVVE
ncbi:MAG TPA: zf-HC2 domain-containing protein, partial [Thermoanaerobaculia bacterium]